MSCQLSDALSHPLWVSHKPGDAYDLERSGGGEWQMFYYPIFEDGKTGKEYKEPRALWLQIKPDFWDLRESPLRYAKRLDKPEDLEALLAGSKKEDFALSEKDKEWFNDTPKGLESW